MEVKRRANQRRISLHILFGLRDGIDEDLSSKNNFDYDASDNNFEDCWEKTFIDVLDLFDSSHSKEGLDAPQILATSANGLGTHEKSWHIGDDLKQYHMTSACKTWLLS